MGRGLCEALERGARYKPSAEKERAPAELGNAGLNYMSTPASSTRVPCRPPVQAPWHNQPPTGTARRGLESAATHNPVEVGAALSRLARLGSWLVGELEGMWACLDASPAVEGGCWLLAAATWFGGLL